MKNKIVLSLFLSVSMLFLFTSCSGRNNEKTIVTDRTAVNDNMNPGATKNNSVVIFQYDEDYSYAQRDELRDDLKDAIDNLNNKIDDMQSKAGKASKNTQDWYNNRISELKEKRENLKDKVDKIDDTSEQDWKKFQADLKDDWNNIQQSWNKIVDRIKSDTGNY